MNRNVSRRTLLQLSAKMGAAAALTLAPFGGGATPSESEDADKLTAPHAVSPLHPSDTDPVPVAFLLSDGAVMIDFAGPWEVFQDVRNPLTKQSAFQLYTVAQTAAPIRASGGMKIVPDYTLQNAPIAKVLVIPAQNGESPAVLNWIRESTKHTDVTMSICTGSFLLAATGLLAGRAATTHHAAYKTFEVQYPNIHVERGMRFVEDGNLASSGGLSSGIDLALHIVERYFGQKIAQQTADNMEYQGQGWMDPKSNSAYLEAARPANGQLMCAVCGMEADKNLSAQYHGRTYYFCEQEHRQQFLAAPDKFVS